MCHKSRRLVRMTRGTVLNLLFAALALVGLLIGIPIFLRDIEYILTFWLR